MDLRARRGWAAIFILLPVGTAAAQTSEWTSDYGRMVLEQDGAGITGYYPDYEGTLFGEYQPESDQLSATWVQPTSEVRCKESRQGSHYWGTVVFQRVSEGILEGQWAYCDDPPGSGGAWRGQQTGGAQILVAQEAPSPGNAPPEDVSQNQAYALLDEAFRSTVPYDELQELAFDMTCDAADDVIFGWPEGSNPDFIGHYNVMIVHDDTAERGLTYDMLRFPNDSSHQFGLCTGPSGWPEPLLEIEYMARLEAEVLDLDPNCGAKLRIDDGYCDSIRVYWNVGGGPDARVILDRN